MRFFIGVLVGSGLTYWSITGINVLSRVIALFQNNVGILTGGVGV